MIWAQGKRAEPYRINSDVMGESVEEYWHNNPKCTFLDEEVRPSELWPGRSEQYLMCYGDDEQLPDGHFDTAYGDVPMRTMSARFVSREGLVELSLRFSTSEYARVREQVIRDFGRPKEGGSAKNDEFWSNGVSRIELNQEGGDLVIWKESYFRKAIVTLSKKARQ